MSWKKYIPPLRYCNACGWSATTWAKAARGHDCPMFKRDRQK